MYFGEREPQWLIYGIFFRNYTLSVHVKPEQIFRPTDVMNRFTELRHSKEKYKIIFNKASSPPSSSPLLKLPNINTRMTTINQLVTCPLPFSFLHSDNLLVRVHAVCVSHGRGLGRLQYGGEVPGY